MMKKTLFLLVIFITSSINPQNNTSAGCNCFLLVEQNSNLTIEKIFVDNNTVQVVNDKNVITAILSWGEGMSGDMIKTEKREGSFIIQCKDGVLKVKHRSKDGSEKSLPDVNVDELKNLDIRVNVTGRNGLKKALVIKNYNTVINDDGPVLDMFGSKISINDGDYLITTETKSQIKVTQIIQGSVEYELNDNWIIVPVYFANNQKLNFVLDLAATSTVINKKILPAGIEIKKVEMITYNSSTNDTSNSSMQGATGTLTDDLFLGKALIPVLNIGTIDVINTNVSVLEAFPQKLEGLGVAGILGLDILEQFSKIKILGLNNTGIKSIIFEEENYRIAPQFSLTIKKAGGLFFTDGSINSHQIEFVIDFGSRQTILSKPLFEKMNDRSFSVIDKEKTITGIDGKPSNAFVISVQQFYLANYQFDNQQVVVGDIAALQSYGLQNTSALLGMNFFNRFDAVEIDFRNKALNLWK
jgi:predicted aspartyl protease